MGQRGPAPAPVALRILRGEDHKARLARAPQPKSQPARPADLTAQGAKVWDRIIAATADTAHIGEANIEALRQYSELTVTINAMRPWGSKEQRELILVHLRLARELCLTPATGANLGSAKAPERKLDKYVAG